MHEDPLDTCPYDPVHRIIRSRMPYHLARCRQNFPDSNMKQCPFDARHLVKAVEYNYHVNTCSSRGNVVHYKLQDEEASKYQNILPIETKSLAEATTHENWDDEPEVKTYNPENNILNRPIVRSTVGLSKSKRHQFKMEERRRFQELEANNEHKQKLAAQIPSIKVDDNDNEYKPLRRPKKPSETLNSSALSFNSSVVSAAGEKPLQQKKSMPERQAKANTSVELNVTNEQLIDNSLSRHNRSDVLLGKMTRKLDGLKMDDAAHDKKTEELNKEIEKLKTLKKKSDSRTDKDF